MADEIDPDMTAILPRLYERDIDVILQEEIIFNEHVAALLSHALDIGPDLKFGSCELSVTDSTGETDVLAHFVARDGKGVILIENKIDAAFQPLQPERYRERALSHATVQHPATAFTVLIAPQSYIRGGSTSAALFDATIEYEQVADAIKRQNTPRSSHRAGLLLRAVEQAKKAYVLVPSEQVGDLWTRIHGIASDEFPDLQMPPPKEKGSQSKWLIFKADLPPKVTIDWKITKGTVDLSFWKSAREQLPAGLDISSLPNAKRVLLGETTAISISVSKPPQEWTALSDEGIRTALAAADRLLTFYHNNISP